MLTAISANFLDLLAEARTAEAALAHLNFMRRLVAGEGIFSIQQNVTTQNDPPNEIRLRRFYSSEAERFPVQTAKRKTRTPWTERLYIEGRPFIGEGETVLAANFDDFLEMREYGVRSVINVPLLQGNLCYATMNIFGTRDQWLAHEIAGIRLLALAAARWVPVAPGLSYRFDNATLPQAVEA